MDEIEKLLNEIEIVYLRQKHQIYDLKKRLEKEYDTLFDRLSFKIVKKVLFFIEKGIDEESAVRLVYDDFKEECSFEDVKKIWLARRPKKSGLLLYGRCYCAQKMHAAGYSLTDIARVLGVSITTVSKLTKKTILSE